ncbi:MAG: hypothetical protein QXX36_00345 [Candidatus Rehaiarchaeum fermentans]|nr:hypothetical protein [Candidatus Rehaiarchaeum fermentans]MCW1297182.1 hypothetical protein [Candidatus Rehaiarchaeum fermentans]MCW1302077.1 hypothetical protein [Candidatus Rehaiarchaeum fermentans]
MRSQAILIIFLPMVAISLSIATLFSFSLNSFESYASFQIKEIEFSYIANSLCSMKYLNSSTFSLFNIFFQQNNINIFFNGSVVSLNSQNSNTYLLKRC